MILKSHILSYLIEYFIDINKKKSRIDFIKIMRDFFVRPKGFEPQTS